MSALSGTSLTVTTLTTAGLLSNNTSGQVSSVTGSTLAALLGGAPSFTGLTLTGLSSVLLKVSAGGVIQAATANTDYQAALTSGTNITITSGTIATSTTPTFTSLTISGLASGMLKVTSGVVSLATANTDYQAALTPGTNITITSNTVSTVTGPTFTALTLGTLSGVLSAVSGVVNTVVLSTSLTFTSGTNTLATIQDIRATASPTFAALTLSSLGTGVLKVTSGVVTVAVGGTDYAASVGTNQLFGAGTLPVLTSGTNNIAIGNAAGTVVTTGTYNVYIGANSRASSVGVTGEIVIGADAVAANVTGKGTNTAFIESIAGLFFGKYVPAVSGATITPSSNANGSYMSLGNGLLIQWISPLVTGSHNPGNWSGTTWTFPVAFTTRCIGVIFFNSGTYSGGLSTVFGASSVSTTSAAAQYGNQWTSSQSYSVCGLAIGY